MANIDKAFEVEGGVVIDDGAALLSGSSSPVGLTAPMGSIYLRTDNTWWEKFSGSDNDWRVKIDNVHPQDLVSLNETIEIDLNKQHIIVTEMQNFGAIINNGTLGVL